MIKTCIVTQSLADGPAWAITEDTNEMVYIGRGAAEALKIEQFDRIKCVLAPNKELPEKTPWYAVTIKVLEEAA